MFGKRMIYLSAFVAFVAAVAVGWKLTARAAYESAAFAVLKSDGRFETRAYADLMMATTSMRFASQGDDGSFMRLFRYIGGRNDGQQKVAMTTPVFMQLGTDEDLGQMGFVIPKKTTEERIPAPSDENVRIQKRVGGRFAVIRFAGRIDTSSVKTAEEALRQWMKQQGLMPDGDAELAGYDPPWTPGLFRRNEILLRLKKDRAGLGSQN